MKEFLMNLFNKLVFIFIITCYTGFMIGRSFVAWTWGYNYKAAGLFILALIGGHASYMIFKRER